MRTTYDEADDILTVHLSEKPIARECSQELCRGLRGLPPSSVTVEALGHNQPESR
ncbi:hypothetical protein SAMN05660831_00220 [Thiohalospira halophila DSM 15071]|uniref:DUF2283 domain-containing protein n=1 Tax=Thiohalospira halophila DSM 15071 TaxID=1123397 RepID=A0A1I1NL45_9GAMM|nr:hypothetical protein SAMN05660831_00220 [Thiohalospira halophila DSM 15071]